MVQLTLDVKLNRGEHKNTFTGFQLLAFSSKSRVTVDTDLSEPVKVNLGLHHGDFLNVQLYSKSNGGLCGRSCQRILATAALVVDAAELDSSSRYDMALTEYFNESCQKVAVLRLSGIGTTRLMREERFVGYTDLTPGTRFVSKFLSRVRMPYYFDENTQSRLPGGTFFLFPRFERTTPENEWIAQFRKILQRCSKKLNIRSLSIENVLEKVSIKVHPVYFIADVITDVVTRYPYRTDCKESFDDVFFNASGDCEDFAKGMLRALRELRHTCEHAKSIFMASVGNLLVQYHSFAALGSVLKPSYGGSCPGKAAHMFGLLIPSTQVHQYLGDLGTGVLTTLPTVILEGTARVSYLFGEYIGNCERQKATMKHSYPLLPIGMEPTSLTNFYFEVSYMFCPEWELFKRFHNPTFSMVSAGIQGVRVENLLNHVHESVRMKALKPYDTALKHFVLRNYMRAQRAYNMSIPKLPLVYPLETIVYFKQSSTETNKIKIVFIDMKDWKTMSFEPFHRVVKEDRETMRLEYIES